MAKNWWKILTVITLLYVLVVGLVIEVPRLDVLNETIRNLFFHVPMWFSMIFIFLGGLIHGIQYLNKSNKNDGNETYAKSAIYHDHRSSAMISTGIIFGLCGLFTGMFWANHTWGTYWPDDDPKLHGSAISLLIYLAYLLLRNSIKDEENRAKISAIYSVFAFVMMLVFIGYYPRTQDSLHPGAEGNPGFNSYDLNNTLKMVFYPAVLGWALLAFWIASIKYKFNKIKWLKENQSY